MLKQKKENIGLKLYSNKNLFSDAQSIAVTLPETNPLEIGFYNSNGGFGYGQWTKDAIDYFFFQHNRRIVHLSMRNSVFAYGKQRKVWHSELIEEISHAADLQASYAIIHDVLYPAPYSSSAQEEEFLQILKKNVEYLHQFIPMRLFLENTFQSLDFYRKLFEQIQDKMDFCFDIGHARLWSKADFSEWKDFLHLLQERGHQLHFHLHSNDGVYDRHESFVNLPQPQMKTFAQELIQEFTEANFIFEIRRDYAATLEEFA